MNASTTHLQTLLEGVKQFVIPLFQRPYTWGNKNEWKVLWEDIYELYLNENPKPHFIGSIVTLPQTSVPEGVSKYSVIDGQQRLTTLIVILLIIRDKYREIVDNRNADRINEYLLVNKYQDNIDYFKLLPSQKFSDRETYFSIVNSKNVDSSNQISKAYIFFEKKIRLTKDLDLIKIEKIITNYLSLVSITLDINDNPYLVFESLNAKGTPLNASDLIRNYLFMRIHINNQTDLFNEFWDPMEKNLEDNLTEFIRHYLMKDGSIVNKSDIYFTLKNKVNVDNAIEYLKSLHKFSSYYYKLIRPENEVNSNISARIKRLNNIEVTTSYPMLLNFYEAYDNNLIDEKQFDDILYLLENYLIRRFVSRKPTRELNKIFPSVIRNLVFDDTLYESFKNSLASKGYPKDYEFQQGFSIMKFYGGADLNTKTKFILNTIESHYEHKERVLDKNLNIEHIMPQTLNEQWKEELGENHAEDHEIYLHSIGNLTLTAYNSELSNNSFFEKKKLLQQSHLEINKYFNNIEKWNKESIERRTNDLFNVCNEIWKFFGPDNILIDNIDVKYSTPIKLTIMEQDFKVETWRDVFENTCNFLIAEFPELMINIDKLFPAFFSRDENRFISTRRLTNGILMNVGLSSKSINNICLRLIELADIEEDFWIVKTTASF